MRTSGHDPKTRRYVALALVIPGWELVSWLSGSGDLHSLQLAIAFAVLALGLTLQDATRKLGLAFRLHYALVFALVGLIDRWMGAAKAAEASFALAALCAVIQLWEWGYPNPERQLVSR